MEKPEIRILKTKNNDSKSKKGKTQKKQAFEKLREKQIRCFIALDLPPKLKKELVLVQKAIKEKDLIKARFTKEDNLHLTLKFLGEISEEKVLRVQRVLEKLMNNNPNPLSSFNSIVEEAGLFIRKNRSILWVKLSNVEELQRMIDNALADEGLFSKEHRFMSHVTIARVKEFKDLEKLRLELKLMSSKLKNTKLKNIKATISSFSLMSSVLKPEGPVYKLIKRFYLKKPD